MTIKQKIIAACVLLTSLGLTKISLADINTPRIDQRQENQERRIEQGVASGTLTEHEANHLQNQQDRIGRLETNAKADGIVTRSENTRLTHKQNKADRAITRKKQNLRLD
jgi:hypothetical protein